MHSKLEAAKLAMEHGVVTVITSANDLENLYRVFDDEEVGTRFEREGQA